MARLIGKDVGVFTVAGNSLLALFRDCELELTNEMEDCSAVKDDYDVPAIARRTWRMRCSTVVETSPLLLTIAQNNSMVAVVFQPVSGGAAFQGTALIQNVRLQADRGPQIESLDLVNAVSTAPLYDSL